MTTFKFDIRYRWQGRSHHHKGIRRGHCGFPGLTLETTETGTLTEFKLIPGGAVKLKSFVLEIPCAWTPEDRILVNGFQSWTASREVQPGEGNPKLAPWGFPWVNKYRFKFYSEDHFFPRTGGQRSHSFLVSRRGTRARFWGALSEDPAYSFFEIKPGKLKITLDVAGLEFTEALSILRLFEKTGNLDSLWQEYHHLRGLDHPPAPALTGWTSWYNFYENVREEDIHRCLEGFAQEKIPFQVFQLDDGWQRSVGDWLPNEKFSAGLEDLTQRIHQQGLLAGLWLAPFVVEHKSALWKDHPEWFQRDARGRLQEAHFNDINWSGKVYALNPFHPEVQEHLKRTFERIADWGFDLVKLDFLFAGALSPPPGMSRGQAMTRAVDLLRSLWKGRILGCGVPLGPAAGKFEYCRIGADVSLMWEDHRLKALHYPERVSTINSLTSTLGRWALNGPWFGNDPDVYILRDGNTTLTPAQKQTLAVLNHLLGNLVFTSDDPTTYKAEHWRLIKKTFPHRLKEILSVDRQKDLVQIHARIQGREYRIFSNLGKPWKETALPLGLWFESRKPWTKGGPLTLESFQTRVFLWVPDSVPALAGSENHLFPGSEVETWSQDETSVNFTLHPDARPQGPLWIRIPAQAQSFLVNGKTLTAQHHPTGRYVQVDP